ncbi:copper resistance CopC family protein [Peribacillus saganii]|uniref:copper resistance CopC family protein n=1 Tax=Peribacillus saganii TaxID=2303992 RepID=UPI003899C7EA
MFFAFASPVSAHTGLESSSPSNGETITEDIQEIVMEFESVIEIGSSFSLLSEAGKEIPVQDIQVNGNTLTGKASELLENGNYTVKWSVVGEDGHQIDGEYGFTVATENTTEENIEPKEETTPSPATEEPKEEQKQSTAASDVQEENQSNPPFMPVLAGLLVVVALIVVVWLMRKGRGTRTSYKARYHWMSLHYKTKSLLPKVVQSKWSR